MLKAFKEKDPDGNGKDDTYGLVMVKWTAGWGAGFDQIKLWFGAPNVWGERDGQLVPEFEYDEYLEALKFMKSCMTKTRQPRFCRHGLGEVD